LLALATSVIAARVLGREAFGEVGIIQSTVLLFGTLAGMGLGLTTTKYVAEFRHKDPARAGRVIGMGLITGAISGLLIAAAVAVFAPWLAAKTLAAPQLAPLLVAGSILVLLLAVNGTQLGALSGFEAFQAVARINVLVGFLTCPLVVAGILLGGVAGAVWGSVVASAVNVCLAHRAMKAEAEAAGIFIRWRDSLDEWPLLVSFSMPALIANVLAAPANWACNAMLVNQPHGYAEMGVLNAINQWYYAVLFLPGALMSNAMPVLAERMASGDRAGLRKNLALGLKINAAVVAPIVLLGCLASHFILGFYGSGFQGHASTLMVTLLTAAVLALQIPIGQIVIASGRMWVLAGVQAVWACLFCGGTWGWISRGALGLVSARLVACVALTVVTVFLAWQRIKPRPTELASSHS
jgi:O-antigen/teichoic acid export membrane protein